VEIACPPGVETYPKILDWKVDPVIVRSVEVKVLIVYAVAVEVA
jgi:hypothetical protein